MELSLLYTGTTTDSRILDQVFKNERQQGQVGFSKVCHFCVTPVKLQNYFICNWVYINKCKYLFPENDIVKKLLQLPSLHFFTYERQLPACLAAHRTVLLRPAH